MDQKRVLAIHDISCIGRCSLTVALPIISAAGVECAVMPTAILSTHTGGFKGYTYRDLEEDLIPIAEHWASLGLRFDAVYTGFLGSQDQVNVILKTIDMLTDDDTMVVVDPVMGDDGRMYPVFPKTFPREMRRLCNIADVIIPNVTEAMLLLGKEAKPTLDDSIEDTLMSLGAICKGNVVLTGASDEGERTGVATYSKADGGIYKYPQSKIPGTYHGTGDVFGSILVSALMRGWTLNESSRLAANLTKRSIERAYSMDADTRYGVQFEKEIPTLIEMLDKGMLECL